MTLLSRYQSSSQDSAASSLTADRTPQRQDCNPTPERLQPQGNQSTNRRKRLVRQFSLWVRIDDCCWRAELPNQHFSFNELKIALLTWIPQSPEKKRTAFSTVWKWFLYRTICRSFNSLSLSVHYLSVTMRMKTISQKHLQPSPPRVWQSLALAAHWTNRYNHLYTHR